MLDQIQNYWLSLTPTQQILLGLVLVAILFSMMSKNRRGSSYNESQKPWCPNDRLVPSFVTSF